MARQQYYVLANNNTEIAYGNSTSLPVELLGFTARKLGHDVQLDWATSMEINNSHFEIEKAVDGAEFVAVGKIAGQGTSESETGYDYLDQSEMGDVNIYRLKQVDIDGTYTYSESLEIRFDELASEYLSVYPVPAREHITVEANTDIAQSMSLHIRDAAGKAVWEGSLEKGSPARIDITAFPAGVYLLKASSGSFQQVKQFVKID